MTRVKKQSAFTLIELLVVIAIIAILAGILFPVMATVQESARRGNTMSNLQKIAQGVSAYELDNHEYPEFLFGPALCKTNGLPDATCTNFYTMRETAALVTGKPSGATELANARNARRIFTKSLYPEYIRDVDAFTSPNNNTKTGDATVALATRKTFLDTSSGAAVYRPRSDAGVLVPAAIPFYKYDAFDASPIITDYTSGAINTSGNTYAARYSRLWEPIVADPNALGGPILKNYQRQLLWAKPPSETVVTATTHHAPKGKIIVLWLNGTVKVIDILKYKNLTADPAGDKKFYQLGPQD
jgi:prepilin-type N-terminal cleavage/methylation domain-containing protein